MKNYILVDSLNMFFRAKHVGSGKDIDMRVGMAMHIIFNSVKKAWNDFDGNHVVFCLEGRSWRKDFYTPYKANRKVTRDQRSPREMEDDELFFEAYDDMCTFLAEKSNCTVIRQSNAEADDLIATWIQQHPDDKHVIVSTDSDFYQLIAPNVTQYNGTTDQIITLEGFKNGKTGATVIDKKTGEPKKAIDPEFVLFEKCVRGDSSDNVFSAYPGARLKGTKNKTGITEAYNDRHTGGYNFNNFMLQRWVDHNGDEHVVKDDFERNMTLIDLTAQPYDLKVEFIETMVEQCQPKEVGNVGINFLRWCNEWDLQNLAKYPDEMARVLNKKYPV